MSRKALLQLCLCSFVLLALAGAAGGHSIAQDRFQSSPAWQTWCMQARTCPPTISCTDIRRGGDWEVCLDHLKLTDCLVYSIGIANDWAFDKVMAELGCEVHSFDPTISLPGKLSPNVTFHQWGLQAGDIAQKDMQRKYGEFKGPLLTLPHIIEKLGHEHRHLSVLKIDCEGCEWDAIQSLFMLKGTSLAPDQLLFEIHLSTQYGIRGEEELEKIQAVYRYLFEPDEHGQSFFRFSWHDNIGFEGMRTIAPPLLAIGLPPDTCCRELGFVKGSHSAPRPHRHMPVHSAHLKSMIRHSN